MRTHTLLTGVCLVRASILTKLQSFLIKKKKKSDTMSHSLKFLRMNPILRIESLGIRRSCQQLLSPSWSLVDSLVWLVLPFLLTKEATSLKKEDPLFIQMHERTVRVPSRVSLYPSFYSALYVTQTSPLGILKKDLPFLV